MEVNREVNWLRRKLKRGYFDRRMGEISEDLRATWEVLGEVLRGKRGRTGAVCRYFEQDGEAVTDGAEIAGGFCDFYSQVGPKLAARLGREREGAFLEYMGERVEGLLIWRPTTPREVEELCRGLDTGKAAGWDGVSPRVVKGVARELSGSLSRLFNCCMREGHYPTCFKVARGRNPRTMQINALSPSFRSCLNFLREYFRRGWSNSWIGMGSWPRVSMGSGLVTRQLWLSLTW